MAVKQRARRSLSVRHANKPSLPCGWVRSLCVVRRVGLKYVSRQSSLHVPRQKWSTVRISHAINAGGPGNPSIPIRFYYRIRELNFYLPGLPGRSSRHARTLGSLMRAAEKQYDTVFIDFTKHQARLLSSLHCNHWLGSYPWNLFWFLLYCFWTWRQRRKKNKRRCWTIYVITNFITNKNHYHNYRSETQVFFSDTMTKRPKTVTRTIITTHTPKLLLTNDNPESQVIPQWKQTKKQNSSH
jgi:hypothetical protein